MAEVLTLTSPVTHPSETTWSVEDIYLSTVGPAIKVTLVSNTGLRYVYRAVPSDTVTAAQILAGLSFINQGKFMTVQSKSLQAWLLDKIAAELAAFAGTVSGTPS